jgi:hypothetical protein
MPVYRVTAAGASGWLRESGSGRLGRAYGPWPMPMVLVPGAWQAAPAWDNPINEPWGVSGTRQLSGDWLMPMNTADTIRAIASDKKIAARRHQPAVAARSPPRHRFQRFHPRQSLADVEPGEHREHRGQPGFASLQHLLDAIENALLPGGQTHSAPSRCPGPTVIDYPACRSHASPADPLAGAQTSTTANVAAGTVTASPSRVTPGEEAASTAIACAPSGSRCTDGPRLAAIRSRPRRTISHRSCSS